MKQEREAVGVERVEGEGRGLGGEVDLLLGGGVESTAIVERKTRANGGESNRVEHGDAAAAMGNLTGSLSNFENIYSPTPLPSAPPVCLSVYINGVFLLTKPPPPEIPRPRSPTFPKLSIELVGIERESRVEVVLAGMERKSNRVDSLEDAQKLAEKRGNEHGVLIFVYAVDGIHHAKEIADALGDLEEKNNWEVNNLRVVEALSTLYCPLHPLRPPLPLHRDSRHHPPPSPRQRHHRCAETGSPAYSPRS